MSTSSASDSRSAWLSTSSAASVCVQSSVSWRAGRPNLPAGNPIVTGHGDAPAARHLPMTPPWPDTGAAGREKVKPPLDRHSLRPLTAEQPPQSREQWERWWLHITRRAIAASYLVHYGRPSPAGDDQTRLLHASCQRGNPALQPAMPSRLA